MAYLSDSVYYLSFFPLPVLLPVYHQITHTCVYAADATVFPPPLAPLSLSFRSSSFLPVLCPLWRKKFLFFFFSFFFVTCSSSSANHTALPSASARSRFFCSLADSDVLSCNFFFSFLLPVNGSLGSARNFCLSVFSHKNIFLTTLPFSFSFLFFLPRFFSSSFPLFPDPFPSFPFRLPSPSLSNFIFFLLVLLP